jgi:hypothetical protein
MAETSNAPSTTLDTIRKWVRDLCIIAGVLFLVVYPAIIGRFLREAKVQLTYNEAEKTWTVRAIEDNRNLATQIVDLTARAQALQDQLKSGPNEKADPALSSLSKGVDALAAKANAASESAAASLANQQTAPGAPAAAQVSDGWIFLGKVSNPNAEAWAGRHYIRADRPRDLTNNNFAVDGSVFLHAGGQAPGGTESKGWHARQQVIGAIKSGEIVHILDTEVDPAVDGGWAMWAQVKRAP